MILVYTPSVWLETNLTTAQKLSFLDNLETMYSQSVDYIDAITHSSSYFTDAECNARYFSSATDGTGSGLIAATLDGYTSDQIIAAGSPSGVIAWWSGSEASIATNCPGWVLCNGLNGTPDLRNDFVPGSGSHYAKGDTGGANTVKTTGTVTIAGHELTESEMPLHSHGTIRDYYEPAQAGSGPSGWNGIPPHYMTAMVEHPSYTAYAGSGTAHTHTASYTGDSGQEKRPPYYALCFIQKS
ncbi:hypothetical protein M0R72_15770 [Candidatus Pacearchaeota archaeon]|jgi:hypothetical protein|nr:hypothetical protein [Candidatus Pacearchaeota archaeon]